MPNLGTIATAIAARYAPGALPATPAGADAIRSSSANLPNDLGARPCILVFPDQGTFDAGNGSRLGSQEWLARLYYDELGGGDLERDTAEIRDWLTLLVDQHKAQLQLGGAVLLCRAITWRIGILTYAGVSYTGAEIRIHTETAEPWDATA